MKTTASPVYLAARNAQHIMIDTMDLMRGGLTVEDVYDFENEMNGMSGEILNLDHSLQLEIQKTNAEIVSRGTSAGVIVSLVPSVLPPKKGVESGSYSQQGKKLYPLTTSVVITANIVSSNTGIVTSVGNTANGFEGSTSSSVIYDANVISSLTSDEEEIDPIFAENDMDEVTEEPLSSIQNETAPYISNSLITLARTAAGNTGGLEDGLTTFSHNPLADVISGTQELFLYYTQNNFANLNVALSGIYGDGALTNEYKTLRTAIGGIGGYSGCIAQLEMFSQHTNRLSGLLLANDSTSATNSNDSTNEFFTIDDISAGPVTIFSFDSRKFRTGKYLISATASSVDGAHQVTELTVLHNDVTTFTVATALANSVNTFVTYSSQLSGTNVEIRATISGSNNNTYFAVCGTKLQIVRSAKAYNVVSQQKIIQQHEALQSILNDGIDYVTLQSVSLTRKDLIANLARLFNDMLATFSSGTFLAGSTGTKQAAITTMATNFLLHCVSIQSQIDADYSKFVELQRLIESLDIAYDLTVINTDSVSNTTVTLNSVTAAAINESQ